MLKIKLLGPFENLEDLSSRIIHLPYLEKKIIKKIPQYFSAKYLLIAFNGCHPLSAIALLNDFFPHESSWCIHIALEKSSSMFSLIKLIYRALEVENKKFLISRHTKNELSTMLMAIDLGFKPINVNRDPNRFVVLGLMGGRKKITPNLKCYKSLPLKIKAQNRNFISSWLDVPNSMISSSIYEVEELLKTQRHLDITKITSSRTQGLLCLNTDDATACLLICKPLDRRSLVEIFKLLETKPIKIVHILDQTENQSIKAILHLQSFDFCFINTNTHSNQYTMERSLFTLTQTPHL
ncbi:hypothetical protein N8199_04485 [Emcibacteraceae bacterium]|nr:hypothetical protein [Emcibacteraceae bacterium]